MRSDEAVDLPQRELSIGVRDENAVGEGASALAQQISQTLRFPVSPSQVILCKSLRPWQYNARACVAPL